MRVHTTHMGKMDEVKALRLAREARTAAKLARGRPPSSKRAAGQGRGGASGVAQAGGDLPGREDMRTEVALRSRSSGAASPLSKEGGAAVRLIFPASPELAKRIDDYWHSKKLRSRSEAIRELLEYALS